MPQVQIPHSLEREVVALRRAIHEEPELGWEEIKTREKVSKFLCSHGYETRRMAGTGLVADLTGAVPRENRRRIMIRADLDALPVTENTALAFSSKHEGLMHTCGHDMHVAIVAGLAALLKQREHELAGDVRFVFQPAEEGSGVLGRADASFPDGHEPGTRAAVVMIREGVLDSVDAVIGVHCWPDLTVGSVGVDPKTAMAGNAALRVRVLGQGGHGATPHKTIDPVPIAATLILALQTVASRRANPSYPFVLSVGKMEAGTAANVIPDSVSLAATLRSNQEGFLETELPQTLNSMILGITEGMGGRAEIEYIPGVPPVINDARMVSMFTKSMESLPEIQSVVLDEAAMTSEDFAYYAQQVPGLYIKIGVAGPDGCAPLHSPFFNPDERAMVVGIRAMYQFVLDYLNNRL